MKALLLPSLILIHQLLTLPTIITSQNAAADTTTTTTTTTETKSSSSTTIDIDDGIYGNQIIPDPSCEDDNDDNDNSSSSSCYHPPDSTVEQIDLTILYGGQDPDSSNDTTKNTTTTPPPPSSSSQQPPKKQQHPPPKKRIDKHWGSDPHLLLMRDTLLTTPKPRPPIFLMPGLAATRLVAWHHKKCRNMLQKDVKVQDYVWLNVGKILETATIDHNCFIECMTLGLNQSDGLGEGGCKLRPDEGLDAISSLAPGSLSSNILVGGTNTVYAWLVQWLADNLGYDVNSIVGLPYDWRLSPDVMETRDGFLTLTKKRIESSVESNGSPGIMVAHSMGNTIFRYFLEWLRSHFHKTTYKKLKATQSSAKKRNGPPGWLGGLPYIAEYVDINRVDDLWNKIFPNPSSDDDNTPSDNILHNHNDDNDKDDDVIIVEELVKEKEKVLWELAMVEGDMEWMAWLKDHIWAYVGLGAPLLGAVNPVRAVLSGENMGLPITDMTARIMELSFGSTHTVNPISTKMGFCDNNHNDDDNNNDTNQQKRHKFPPRSSTAILPNGQQTTTSSSDTFSTYNNNRANLACLDELLPEIDATTSPSHDPWRDFKALRLLLKDRIDWDTAFPLISVQINTTTCRRRQQKKDDDDSSSPPPPTASENSNCRAHASSINFGPRNVQDGEVFRQFSRIWNEEGNPLNIKRDQLVNNWWRSKLRLSTNILNTTWDRPHIKHVIMAYGVDVPTEVGYVYTKEETIVEDGGDGGTTTDDDESSSSNAPPPTYDGVPTVHSVIWSEAGGNLFEEPMDNSPPSYFSRQKKKLKKRQLFTTVNNSTTPRRLLHHSGDGTIPYLSLSWAHTWLLHAERAQRHGRGGGSGDNDPPATAETITTKNALQSITVSHRPKGGAEWIDGNSHDDDDDDGDDEAASSTTTTTTTTPAATDDISDTGTSHPHGTKYKPEMVRFRSSGRSRNTGMEYTTTVIEAIGVEHKETTRNYDILAAAFTEVLKSMHDDFGFV